MKPYPFELLNHLIFPFTSSTSLEESLSRASTLQIHVYDYSSGLQIPAMRWQIAAWLRPGESRRAKRLHGLTSALGVIVPTALGQLGTLSLPHWAGSSTMAFGQSCCGFIGPVPSATLDKCRFVAATGEFLADSH